MITEKKDTAVPRSDLLHEEMPENAVAAVSRLLDRELAAGEQVYDAWQSHPDENARELALSAITLDIKAIGAIELILRVRKTSLSRRHNALLPIHRLPEEVLVTIFDSDLSSRLTIGSRRYFARVVEVIQVCRKWAAIINGSPHIWAFANYLAPPVFMERCLARSLDAPVKVTWLGADKAALSIQRFSTIVEKHLSKWQLVIFDDVSEEEFALLAEVGVLERQGAIMLRELRLALRSEASRSINLLGGDAPNLEKLSLNGVTVQNSRNDLHKGLHELTLSNHRVFPLTLHYFRDLMNSCEALRSLDLFNVDVIGVPVPSDQNVVDLLHLEVLSLVQIQNAAAIHIFNSLNTPNCTSYTYCTTVSDDLAALQVLEALQERITPALAPFLETINDIHLYIDEAERVWEPLSSVHVSIRCNHSDTVMDWPSFIIHVACTSAFDTLNWLSNGPLKTILRTVHTRLDVVEDINIPTEHVGEILRLLPCVTHLYTRELLASFFEAVVTVLSCPDTIDGVSQWVCPLLAHWELAWCTGASWRLCLVDMVRARRQGRVTGGNGGMERPVEFERLRVHENWVDDESAEALEGLLGDRFVIFTGPSRLG